MTMIQIVSQLQKQGHLVRYSKRSDGGILIKQIDSEKFPSGAAGNARARQMVGITISEAREHQLKYATRARKVKKMEIDEYIDEEYKRVKKLWNKAFKSKKGKPHKAGYFGKGRIQYAIKHFGKEEALRRIHEAERYASGIAYSKNVELLIVMIRDAGNKYRSQELLDLADDVENNAYMIREEWIAPAYDSLYDLNHGIPPKEVAANTRAILRLSAYEN